MKKKIVIAVSVVFIMICITFAALFLVPKVREEIGKDGLIEQWSISEIFDYDGQFYVYFYKDNCPYCENITDDIKLFEQENKVFLINVRLARRDVKTRLRCSNS